MITLESLKKELSEFGTVVVNRNGNSFRLVLKMREIFPHNNNKVVCLIVDYFHSIGISPIVAANKNNIFAEWEVVGEGSLEEKVKLSSS